MSFDTGIEGSTIENLLVTNAAVTPAVLDENSDQYKAAVAFYEYDGESAEGTLTVGTAEYKFLGWYTTSTFEDDSLFAGTAEQFAQAKVAVDTTLYAKWSKKCTVTFNENTGEGAATKEVTAWQYLPIDDADIPASDPERTNYQFTGWFTNEAGTGNAWVFTDDDATKISKMTGDVTLYAGWAPEYTITFNANGDPASGDDPSAGGYVAANDDVVEGTMTKTQPLYKGQKDGRADVKLNKNTMNRAGYTFKEWNTKADGTGTAYADEAVANNMDVEAGASVNLYAQWTGKSYSVNFQANDGTGTMATQNLVYGTTKLNACAFTREGYTFVGWKVTPNTGTVEAFDSAGVAATDETTIATKIDFKDEAVPAFAKDKRPAADATISLTAVWMKNMYKLTFDADGGKVLASDQQGAQEITQTAVPVLYKGSLNDYKDYVAGEKGGYEFAGWDTALPTEMPANDLTLKAKWTGSDCTVTINFMGHGSTKATDTQTVANGARATEPSLTDNVVGVVFDGWYADQQYTKTFSFDEPITGATSVYAKWIPAVYEVTFDLNGGDWRSAESDVYAPQTVEYGNAAWKPFVISSSTNAKGDTTITQKYVDVEPVRVGYGFGGWYTDPECTKAIGLATFAKNTDVATETDAVSGVTTESVKNGAAGTRGTAITGKTTIYAKWTKMSYQVKFYSAADNKYESGSLVGATDSKDKSIDTEVEYGTTLAAPADVKAPTGKKLDGWFTDSDKLEALYDFNTEVMKNLNLYAKWTDGEYTVAFKANSGKGTMGNQSVTYNGRNQRLAKSEFTRDGYTFVGWSADVNNAGPVKDAAELERLKSTLNVANQAPKFFEDEAAITDQISEATTLYAVWQGPLSYDVTFDGNGATAGSTTAMTGQTAVVYGADAVKLTANGFDRDGYVFTEWNTKADGTGTAYANEAEVSNLTEDITLYAQWAEAVTVTFNENVSGEPKTATQKVKKGAATALNAFTALKNGAADVKFENAGKAFKAWNTEADRTGDAYADMAEVTFSEDTTLYAQWANEAVVTFVDSTGAVLDEVTVDVSASANPTVAYTKTLPKLDGDAKYDVYTYDGWYLKGADEAATYVLNPEGNVVSTATTSGDPATTTYTAYPVNADVTFVAHFKGQSYDKQGELQDEMKRYDVTYIVNGETAYVEEGVTYGKKVAQPNDSYTTVNGYKFTGTWAKEDGTAWDFDTDEVTGATTLTAQMESVEDAANKAAADAVAAEIAELPDAEKITAADKETVQAVKDKFDALTPEQQALVSDEDKAKLAAAVEAIDKAKTDQEAADAAAALIDALPAAADITAENADAVKAAKDAYDALTDAQKELVDAEKAAKLDAAVDASNAIAAQAVTEAIKALPEATAANKDAIDAVKASYDALSDDAKKLVNADDVKALDDAVKAAADAAEKQEAAEKKAVEDKAAYQAAQSVADAAKTAAETAKATAEASQKAAEEAAKTPGDAAVKAAKQAQADAETYQKAAQAYETAAKAAKEAADKALDSAKAAGKTDTELESAAAAAQVAVEGAASAAKNAATAATNAKNATAAAQQKADDAKKSGGKSTAKKAKNPMTVKAKAVKAKAGKKTTIKKAKAFTVAKAQGKVTFKKAKGNKKITVSKAGKVTVKKGLKKGKTYKVKVKVTAAGNAKYNKITKTVTLKVKVK